MTSKTESKQMANIFSEDQESNMVALEATRASEPDPPTVRKEKRDLPRSVPSPLEGSAKREVTHTHDRILVLLENVKHARDAGDTEMHALYTELLQHTMQMERDGTGGQAKGDAGNSSNLPPPNTTISSTMTERDLKARIHPTGKKDTTTTLPKFKADHEISDETMKDFERHMEVWCTQSRDNLAANKDNYFTDRVTIIRTIGRLGVGSKLRETAEEAILTERKVAFQNLVTIFSLNKSASQAVNLYKRQCDTQGEEPDPYAALQEVKKLITLTSEVTRLNKLYQDINTAKWDDKISYRSNLNSLMSQISAYEVLKASIAPDHQWIMMIASKFPQSLRSVYETLRSDTITETKKELTLKDMELIMDKAESRGKPATPSNTRLNGMNGECWKGNECERPNCRFTHPKDSTSQNSPHDEKKKKRTAYKKKKDDADDATHLDAMQAFLGNLSAVVGESIPQGFDSHSVPALFDSGLVGKDIAAVSNRKEFFKDLKAAAGALDGALDSRGAPMNVMQGTFSCNLRLVDGTDLVLKDIPGLYTESAKGTYFNEKKVCRALGATPLYSATDFRLIISTSQPAKGASKNSVPRDKSKYVKMWHDPRKTDADVTYITPIKMHSNSRQD